MVYAPTAPPLLNAQSPDGLPVTTSEEGTSFAAPIVTAQVAMIRAVAPDLTPQEIIEDVIVPTAGLPVTLPGGGLDGIHYTGVALETSAMTFPSCLITERDLSGNPLSVEMEVLVSGTLEMVRPPENPDDPTPDPTTHEFDGYILTSFMLGESENGVPMQGLYDTLETYCFHGLQ